MKLRPVMSTVTGSDRSCNKSSRTGEDEMSRSPVSETTLSPPFPLVTAAANEAWGTS